jgi:hypothetical protein
MSKQKSIVDNLLFKPLVATDDPQKRLIVIYGVNVGSSKAISAKGKLVVSTVTTIDVLDITSTVELGTPVRDNWLVTDPKELKKCFEEVNSEDYILQIQTATSIIHQEMNDLSVHLQDCAKSFSTLQYISNSSDTNELMIGTESNGLAHIVFKTVTGDMAKLNREQIDKIGNVIMEVIMGNVASDLANEETLRKLRAEVNYKLIEALPDNMRADDIHVNMDSFVEEIKKFQGDTESN